jgi:predicted transcriptional regulator
VILLSNRKGNEMESAKEEAIQLIRRLPDDTTLEEIQYHLYVQQKVRRGMQDVEEGKVYSQEEVEKRMKRWVSE